MISKASAWAPGDIVGAMFSIPITSFVIALFLALVLEAWVSRSAVGSRSREAAAAATRSMRVRYRPAHVILIGSAVAVIALSLGTFIIQGYFVRVPDDLVWMRFAAPIIGAIAGLGVVLVQIVRRGTTEPEAPTLIASRRTWSTFSAWRDLIVVTIALVLLVVTTLVAGAASSLSQSGLSDTLEIPVSNLDAVDPVRIRFFGWTYGMPVLVSAAVLIAIVAAVLQYNAVRTFIRPETVAAERSSRRHIARAAVRIVIGALLLSLASAWRLIARAGGISSLEIQGENDGSPYEVAWRFAEFATVAGWCAPILEVAAFTLLLLVAVRLPHGVPALAASGARARQAVDAR